MNPVISYGEGQWKIGFLTTYQGANAVPGTFSVGYQSLVQNSNGTYDYAPIKIVPQTANQVTGSTPAISCPPVGDYDGMAFNKAGPNFVYAYANPTRTATSCSSALHIHEAPIPYPVVLSDGFEVPAEGSTYVYNPPISTGQPWTFTTLSGHNGSGLAGNGSTITTGNPMAPEGTQVAFIRSLATMTANVSFPAAGKYLVSAKVAERVMYQQGPQTVDVRLDSVPMGSFVTGTDGKYVFKATAPFSVSAGTHRIDLVGLQSLESTLFMDELKIQGPL
jgi:hypothetical protein